MKKQKVVEGEIGDKPISLRDFLKEAHAGSGLWVTRIYRYPAAFVACAAAGVGAGPNALTLFSSLLSMLGGGLLVITAEIDWTVVLISFALLSTAYIFDCADGQLARACGSGSKLGAWLDHTLDCFKLVMVNACLGWVAISQAVELGQSIWVGYLAAQLNIAGCLTNFF